MPAAARLAGEILTGAVDPVFDAIALEAKNMGTRLTELAQRLRDHGDRSGLTVLMNILSNAL
jgi:signal transduction histidine kinase